MQYKPLLLVGGALAALLIGCGSDKGNDVVRNTLDRSSFTYKFLQGFNGHQQPDVIGFYDANNNQTVVITDYRSPESRSFHLIYGDGFSACSLSSQKKDSAYRELLGKFKAERSVDMSAVKILMDGPVDCSHPEVLDSMK